MSEPFLGQIQPFGFNFNPRGWLKCDGQLLAIAQNTALFSLLGTTYGGDGRTTFGLPDLRGRTAIHQGSGPGLTPRIIGQKSGSESNTLTVGQMASGFPNVTLDVHDGAANDVSPVGKHLAEPVDGNGNALAGYNTTGGGGNVGGLSVQKGSGQAVNNMQPFLVINYCIATQGIFPSRN